MVLYILNVHSFYFQFCLELLCSVSRPDFSAEDLYGHTVLDVASSLCRPIISNICEYIVLGLQYTSVLLRNTYNFLA